MDIITCQKEEKTGKSGKLLFVPNILRKLFKGQINEKGQHNLNCKTFKIFSGRTQN